MYISIHVKYRYSCKILITLTFPEQKFEKHSNPNLMKICSVDDELFHVKRETNGWKNMTKIIVTFCKFADVPNKMTFHSLHLK